MRHALLRNEEPTDSNFKSEKGAKAARKTRWLTLEQVQLKRQKHVDELIRDREAAREQRDFAEADRIQLELRALGAPEADTRTNSENSYYRETATESNNFFKEYGCPQCSKRFKELTGLQAHQEAKGHQGTRRLPGEPITQ